MDNDIYTRRPFLATAECDCVIGEFWNRRLEQENSNVGAGDGTRSRDVQLEKTTVDCKYRTLRFPVTLSGDRVYESSALCHPTRTKSSTNRAHDPILGRFLTEAVRLHSFQLASSNHDRSDAILPSTYQLVV
jgi:hypothetical protein